MNAFVRRPAGRVSQWLDKRRRKLERYFSNLKRGRDALKAFQRYDRQLAKHAIDAPSTHFSEPREALISAVYFSCHGHFGMLDLSLQSLLAHGSHLKNIWIYEDASDPFSASERAALRGASSIIRLITGPRVTGWGYETLLRELAAFGHVAHDPAESATCWLMKLDSDILFLNSKILSQVAQCNADIFGQPFRHPSGLAYTQGGCYFVATNFVDTLVNAPLTPVMRALSHRLNRRLSDLPEDASIFAIAQSQGARAAFGDYYLPHQRIASFSPSTDEEASVIHFESNLDRTIRQHMPRIGRQFRAA
jgi:hypothetical protein